MACYHREVQVLLALLLAGVVASPSDNAGEILARRVEAQKRSLQDLQAHFVQRYRSGALGREIVESGRVSLKPPGRMLFEYQKPEKKLFVSDGETSYFYVPEERQVIVKNLKGEKALLSVLLSGKESILDRFRASLEPTEGPLQQLRLSPKSPEPDVDTVLLDVDNADRIRRVAILDAEGDRSEFLFDQIRENMGLPDRLFHFTPPKDTEVIEG